MVKNGIKEVNDLKWINAARRVKDIYEQLTLGKAS